MSAAHDGSGGPDINEAFADLLGGIPGRRLWLPVLSGSMAPLLVPGDYVLVETCRGTEISTGDIAVFRQGLSLTAHRVLFRIRSKGRRYLFQQGDALFEGSLTEEDSVVGRCVARRRNDEKTTLADGRKNRRMAYKSRWRLLRRTGKDALEWIIRRMSISRWPRVR